MGVLKIVRFFLYVLYFKLNFVNCSKDGYNFFPQLPVVIQQSENDLCGIQSAEYLFNLKNFSIWAYEMFDSTAQTPDGILRGNTKNFGNYRQCLNSKAPFPTQFCVVAIKAKISETVKNRTKLVFEYEPNDHIIDNLYDYKSDFLRARNVIDLGWCVPASCDPDLLEKYLNKDVSKFEPFPDRNVTFEAKIRRQTCQKSNETRRNFDAYDYLFCTLTTVLFILALMGTWWDYNKEYDLTTKKSFSIKILLAFSARRNFVVLGMQDTSNRALNILNSIKTVGIWIMVVGHHVAFKIPGSFYNFDEMEKSYSKFWTQTSLRADLYVDTCFFISGLLVVYNLMKAYETKFVNPILYIVLRYVRLTTGLAYVIFFTSTVLYHTGNSAIWDLVVGAESNDCRSNWWSNLLYISNLRDFSHECLGHTWYIYNDYHFFLVALALVILYYKGLKKCLIASIVLLFVLSIAVPFVELYLNGRPPILRFLPGFMDRQKLHPDMNWSIYRKPYDRFAVYLIGMVAGYVYFKLKGGCFEMRKQTSVILMVTSLILLMVSMFSGLLYYDMNRRITSIESAFYGSLDRPLWVLGTFGLIFAISYGNFNYMHTLLSWSPFVPLGKLAYGVYLWHFVFDLRMAALATSTSNFDLNMSMVETLSDIVFSYILSLLMYLILEAPVKNVLNEVLLKRRNVVDHGSSANNKTMVMANFDNCNNKN